MPKRSLVMSAVLVLCFALSTAAQTDSPSVEAFLKSTLKAEDELSFHARGDLNGDGLEDWAGVILRKKEAPLQTSQLYVLLRTAAGGFHVREKSKEAEIDGTGCCYVESLEIKRASIYVQNNFKSDNIMEAVTHQFRFDKDKLRLVGIKISRTDFRPKEPTDTDIEMNLLTGAVVEKRGRGEGKPTVASRRRRKFSTHTLREFDFEAGFGSK